MKKIFISIGKILKQKSYTVFCIFMGKPAIFKWAIAFMKRIATGGIGSNECLKNGYLPLPVHFYSPVPDIDDHRRRNIWKKKSDLAGVDFNGHKHLSLLRTLANNFGQKCRWPLNSTQKSTDYYTNNNCFLFGCAASLHMIIRQYKPKTIIEIGSGYSSLIIAKAIEKNKQDTDQKTNYTIIDPFPSPPVSKRLIKFNKLIKKRVEITDPKYFEKLHKNDILFIDSGHTVRIGGDVNFLYLDVLPKLKPGVIIH